MDINLNNYEAYALDYLEGTLTAAQNAAFEKFLLNNPEIASQVGSLRDEMPFLEADTSICFEGKDELKRKMALRPLLFRLSAVAASLAIAFMVFTYYGKHPSDLSGEGNLLSAKIRTSEKSTPVVDQPEHGEVQPRQKIHPAGIGKTPDSRLAHAAANERINKTPGATETSRQTVSPILTSGSESVSLSVPQTLVAEVQIVAADPENVVQQQTVPTNIPTAEMLAGPLNGKVISKTVEYVVETQPEEADTYRDEDSGGLRELFKKNGLKRLAATLITPLSEISPVNVYNDKDERVVEFASIPVSRKSNKIK